jgi:hypothetical protein
MESYEDAWETLRWNERWLKVSLAGLLLSILASMELPRIGAVWPFLVVVFFFSTMVSMQFVNLFKCPRCRNSFRHYYWAKGNGHRCLHCDLERPASKPVADANLE